MKLSMRAVGFLTNIMGFITRFGCSKEEEIESLKTNPQLTQDERDALCTFIMANDTLETVHVYLKSAGIYGHDELWTPRDEKEKWYFRNTDGWYYMDHEPSGMYPVPADRGEKVPNNVLFIVHGYLDNEKFGSGNFIPQFPTVWDVLRGAWKRKCMTEAEAEKNNWLMGNMRKKGKEVSLRLDHEIDFFGYPLKIYEKTFAIDTGTNWNEYWFGKERVDGPLLLAWIGYQTENVLETFECTSEDCAYNNSGECRYHRVFDKEPTITEEDGCIDFVVKI